MKRAGPPAIPKDVPEFATWPVGPWGPTPEVGMSAKFCGKKFAAATPVLPVTV